MASGPKASAKTRSGPRSRPRAGVRLAREVGPLLAATIADAVITIDAHSRILFVNPSASRMFGYAPSEMLGQKLTMLMPDALRERHEASLARYVTTGRKHVDWQGVELVARDKSGREIPVEISFGEAGGRGGPTFTGVVRDITERKRAEAVRSALYLVAERAQASTDMAELYAGIGATLRELMGAKSVRVMLEDVASGVLSCRYLAGEGTIPPGPRPLTEEWTEHILKTGEPFLAPAPAMGAGEPQGSWLGVPLKAGEKTLGALVVRARPESAAYGEREKEILTFAARQVVAGLERHRVQEEMKRTVSVLRSTLDSTADGILVVDHGGRVESFNQRFAQLWRIPRPMLAMRDDTALIAHVLDQLKDPEQFLNKVRELYSQPEAEAFDVLEFKDGRTFERYSIPHWQDGQPRGRVWSFRDVTRARDLEAQVRRSDRQEAIRRLAGSAAQDFNNLLTVITSRGELARRLAGPEESLGRHLEELLGAAERAKALTRQLLAFSRGQALAPPPDPLPAVPTATKEPPGGSETILIVEHHEAVRLVEREILEGQGYVVLEASQGEDALRIPQRYASPVHLIVTDVSMPDMSGPELARRLAGAWPEAKVLFVSGNSTGDSAPDGVLARDAAFLQKPFSPDALARKVREALMASPSH
jgi:PAS domain S-box-containing protein